MSYRPQWNGRSGYAGKRKHLFLRVLLALLLIGVLGFGVIEGVIWAGARDKVQGSPQAMVILGCQAMSGGPSVLLRDRLDTALDYLADHPDMTVVCSGGQGEGEPVSEAACMRDYLVERGVPEERILMEDASSNTWQNLNYSLDLLRENGYDTTADLMVVSSAWHLARVRMLYDRLYSSKYLSTLAAPSSHLPSAVKMFFREPVGVVKSLLLDW